MQPCSQVHHTCSSTVVCSLSALLRSVTYARRGRQKSFELFLIQHFFSPVLNACFTDIRAIKNWYLIAEFVSLKIKGREIPFILFFLRTELEPCREFIGFRYNILTHGMEKLRADYKDRSVIRWLVRGWPRPRYSAHSTT